MPDAALALALGAAALHALWNLLLAGARDTAAVAVVMMVTSIVVFAPVAAVTWQVSWAAAPYIAGSAAFQLAYLALLVAAYERSALSLVYPIARGLAPVLVLAAGAVALSVSPSAGQAAGVVSIGAGVILVRGLGRKVDPRGLALGCLIAGCIAGYTLVDKQGLRYAEPISYFELALLGTLPYSFLIARRRGLRALRAQARPRALVAGVAGFGAYALVLVALERAPAAAVAAVRETSVVIATALATAVLGEPVGLRRVAGAAVVAGGVALIALS
ncbi:MAG: EamA family transporter [Thermoleophilia bacterium]|nr:EamA family transporter [Thermoleophilia bacterium]